MTKNIDINFSNTKTIFEANYSNYTPGMEDEIDFHSGQNPINHSRTFGYLLGCDNRSDDLFMFITTKIDGLEPNYKYDFSVSSLTIATNAANSEPLGVGGAPGKSVLIRVGCYNNHPEVIKKGDYFITNFDNGHRPHDGKNTFIVGDFAKLRNANRTDYYEMKTFYPHKHIEAETNAEGEMWMIFGTDSGYEGRTEAYFVSAHILLTEPLGDCSDLPGKLEL